VLCSVSVTARPSTKRCGAELIHQEVLCSISDRTSHCNVYIPISYSPSPVLESQPGN
jgi:hypothetical protein